MAKNEKNVAQEVPETTEADKKRAQQWFTKAADCRERREYDYAIECFITGLEYWPEAVEAGHMPLRSLAIQRQQAGGKKPGLMDGMKRSMTGKDAKKAMLNAEHLLSMDPYNASYGEGLLKNATKAGLLETCKWAAPVVLDILKKDKKPNKTRFASFREALVEAAAKAGEKKDNADEVFLLEQAVSSLDFLAARMPGDDNIKDELKHLAGRLTIARGKYDEAGDFRESLQDADKQKLLHDSERRKQGEETLEALLQATRKEYEEEPDAPHKVNRYVEVLLRTERPQDEETAIEVLDGAYARTRNYNFKLRADDVRLRQLARQTTKLKAKARDTGSDEDQQQARLAAMEERQTKMEIFRERVANYPTDLRLKYLLGRALFEAAEYDEAIPVLQAAQQDPRYRARCQLLLGRAFHERKAPGQAAEILREALERYEGTDELSKELLYWLGRAYETAEKRDEARDAYGKLLRQDYNYRNGDARKRLEELK